MYAKDPYEAKYELLINKIESIDLKHFNNSKAFIEYSNVCSMFTKTLMNTRTQNINSFWWYDCWYD